MTKEREALKLALEALEEAWYHVGTFQPTEKSIDLYDEARTAIKEALAQPEQEPVTWVSSEELLVMRGNALDGGSEPLTHAGALEAVKFWKEPAAPAFPQGYAGVTIWIGNRKITYLLTELQIAYEQMQGQSITEAAQLCLQWFAATSEQKGGAV